MNTWQILPGDCVEGLRSLPARSVQCCVTSPPYWGLRDYGHAGQIGLEPTPDAYVQSLVAVFMEVRRVLAEDGTMWLNLGDSYAHSLRQSGVAQAGQKQNTNDGSIRSGFKPLPQGFKEKDLVGIPWRVAFALQQPYADHVIRREADRAWLAALVDGEGTMTILQTTSPHGSGDSFPPVLQVRMCDVECIARAAEITGYGKASPRQDPPSQGGVRGSYQWRLSGSRAAKIAADIYPHLCIKRKQAIVLWNHQRVRDSYETKRGVCVPRAAVEQQQTCRDLIKRLNRRDPVDIPSWMEEPTVEVTPGWYLRSDVIWSKPNPMPESVTDRPTKAHEYIFLLSKSASYYYDADAIAESVSEAMLRQMEQGYEGLGLKDYEGAGVQNPSTVKARIIENARKKSLHMGGTPRNDGDRWRTVEGGVAPRGTRNKRSVWHVATQPFSGASLLADYEGDDGRLYKLSADCPVHVLRRASRRTRTAAHDAPQDHLSIGTAGTSSRPGRAPESVSASTPLLDASSSTGSACEGARTAASIDASSISGSGAVDTRNHPRTEDMYETAADSSDLRSLACAVTATTNSSETRRTARDLATTPPCIASVETAVGTGDTSALLVSGEPFVRTPESNSAVEIGGRAPAIVTSKTRNRSAGRSSECNCTPVVVDHFATYPEKLIEPCILAGSRIGDTVLDPFCGSGTTGAVAIRHQRNFIGCELNADYIQLAERRIGNVAPLFSQRSA